MKKQRHQTNTAKLTDLLSVFIQFFFVLFYSRLYCFNQILYCFLWEKVGGSKKSRLLGGSEKNRLLNGVEKWSRRQRHRRCSN